jgi:hypothetical protein
LCAPCSLGGDVAVNSGSTAQVIERDLKAGAATFNVVDNMLLPPDELSSVSLGWTLSLSLSLRFICTPI